MRRRGATLLAMATLSLAGCGDTPFASILLGGQPAMQPGPAAPQGPVLRVTGARRPFVFTLAQETGDRRLWRAEGGAALATEGPRIVAVAGLGPGLSAMRAEDADPLADPRALVGRQVAMRRSLDLRGDGEDAEGLRFGVAVSCTLSAVAEGGWIVVTESCTGPDLAFENRFDAEATTGRVRRSRQWVGDSVLVVEGP